MAITFACVCGKKLQAKDGSAGRVVRCPECSTEVIIPGGSGLAIDLEKPSLESRLSSLADQVDDLRKSNGRLRWMAASALTVAVLSGGVSALAIRSPRASQPSPVVVAPAPAPIGAGVVEMRGLVIRDDKGRIRATLGYDGEMAVGLKLFEGGKLRSDYRVWDNGVPSINFNYFNEAEAFSIGGGGTVEPSMDIFDILGDCRVQFGIHDGAPNLSLHHSKVRTRFQLGMIKNGTPYMDFFDAKDNVLPMLDKAGVPLVLKP